MNIIFMGTPDFSVPALRALVEGGHKVTAVVTQPDKPKGRGKAVQMTPVKEAALELDIPVYQPAKVREEGNHYESEKSFKSRTCSSDDGIYACCLREGGGDRRG